MWIQENDQVKYKNEVLTVLSVDGLYTVASNVTITLQNSKGQKTKINYMSEFYPKYQSGEIKPVNIKKKQSRGY